MLRLNDLLLLLVVFASMAAGIMAPGPSSVLQPYPLYLMMFLLFLSFLSVRIDTVLGTVRRLRGTVLRLCLTKMLIMPVLLYFLCRALYPDYALGVLLLAGVSTGVVAPFMAGILGGDMALVLAMVVLTSPLVPISLPLLVELLPGREFHIPFMAMFKMLLLVIFVPIAAVEISRRAFPALSAALMRNRFPISLLTFAAINLGVFSKYALFFHQNPGTIVEATLVASVLALVLAAAGIFSIARAGMGEQIASAIAFSNMNNVLIIVFAAHFFGPIEPTLAAVYMVPFFGLILPLRIYQRTKGGASASAIPPG